MSSEVPSRGVEYDLGWALTMVMRSYRRIIEPVLAQLPGGPRGYQVLVGAASGDPRTQLALAHYLGLDRTVMTYLLDDLVTAGLVERKPDPSDRRARLVVLTDAGVERLCALERELGDTEETLLLPLEPDERVVLRGMLRRLATRARQTAGKPPDACRVMEELDSGGC